jgi:putative transposase
VVANKAAHLVVGVDLEGRKHVLDIWSQQTEGAKFWSGVLTERRNRGLQDALFVCCDGLTVLPAAVNAVWPKAVVQTRVVLCSRDPRHVRRR